MLWIFKNKASSLSALLLFMDLFFGGLLRVSPKIHAEEFRLKIEIAKSRRGEVLALPLQAYQESVRQVRYLEKYGGVLGYPSVLLPGESTLFWPTRSALWTIQIPHSPNEKKVSLVGYGSRKFKFDENVYHYYLALSPQNERSVHFSSLKTVENVDETVKSIRIQIFRKSRLTVSPPESVPTNERDNFEVYLGQWARDWYEMQNDFTEGFFNYGVIEFRELNENQKDPFKTSDEVWVYSLRQAGYFIPLQAGEYKIEKTVIQKDNLKGTFRASFSLTGNNYQTLRDKDWSRVED